METVAAEMIDLVQRYNVPAGSERAMGKVALFNMVIVCGELLPMES